MTRRWELVRLRIAVGLTQQELADRLAVDRKTVERWETQGRTPLLRHQRRLAKVLGVSLEEIRRAVGPSGQEGVPLGD